MALARHNNTSPHSIVSIVSFFLCPLVSSASVRMSVCLSQFTTAMVEFVPQLPQPFHCDFTHSRLQIIYIFCLPLLLSGFNSDGGGKQSIRSGVLPVAKSSKAYVSFKLKHKFYTIALDNCSSFRSCATVCYNKKLTTT